MHSLTQTIFRKSNCLSLLASGLSLTLGLTYLSGQSVFTTDFEAPDYTTGTLVSDPDWSFDTVDLDVQVTAADYFSGLQSLSLTGAAPFDFSRDPLLAVPSVIWLDLQLKPIFAEVADLPLSFSADRTAVTGFVKLNTEGEVYAVDGDGQGSGQWLATGSYATLSGDQSQDWLRLTYRLDYNTKTWDLFIGGQMIAADLGFLNTAATSFDQFTLRGDETQPSGFDSFDVRQDNPFYTDADNDAIDDAYEIAHGLNTSLNDRDQDLDFDTLSNLAEYLANSSATNADTDGDGVDDGSELANGADPTVADAYSLSSLPFSEDFESAPLGDFSGSAWSISGSTPQVQDSEAASGTQALSLNADTVLSNAIDGSDESVVWIDVYIRPQLLATAPSVDAAQGYYFNQDGQALALDGLGDGSGLWQLLDVATAGDWRRVTTKLDYASQTYDLYIDGGRVATGLGFAKVKPFLSELELSGAALTHADALSASATEPAALDNDRDGWDNATETSATTNPEVFDTDADGLADSLEGLWGYDPLVTESGFAQLTETAASSGIYQWSSSFSIAEGYSDGAVNTQQDWIATGDALIESEQLDLTDSTTADASFERIAGIGETRRLWISFRAKLVPGALPDIVSLNEPAVAIWGFTSSNSLKIWNQQDQDWQHLTTEADAIEWNAYALYFDYVEQEWLLTINGLLIASELPFVDEDLIVFSRFKALQAQYTEGREAGEGPYTASFDDFVFSTAEPAWLDYDGDGLLNSLETQLGSDLLNSDSDGDGMDDLYEYQNGLNLLANDTSGDLDGDGLSNIGEYNFGLSANLDDVDGAAGFVRRDAWTVLGGEYNIEDLTNKSSYPLNPNKRQWATDLDFPKSENFGTTYGQRIYGMIVAPETAEYTFWLSGDQSCEFWLSPNENASERVLLASIKGVSQLEKFTLTNPITLTAGQSYYFELIHTEGLGGGNNVGANNHVNLNWRYGGGSLQAITSESLRVNIPEVGDADGDGLPDSWENTNGLDSSKGYGIDGYTGDLDADGLLNYEEYHLGTDPSLADSDGDGFSDYVELNDLYSDPLTQDLIATPVIVQQVDGSSQSSSRGYWLSDGTALYAADSTGSIGYDLNFTADGAYRLVVEISEQNSYKSTSSEFELRASLNGTSYGIQSDLIAPGATGEVTYYLPYLAAGNYSLDLDWLNGFGDTLLKIHSIRIERIDGADTDASGIADWIENRAELFGDEDLPVSVYTSPFCFEGQSYAPATVSIETYPSSDWSALRVEDVKQALAYTYYSDIALNPNEPRVLVIDDQAGLRSAQLTLTWEAFNAFEHDYLHIRLNDSMLIGAFDPALAETRPVDLVLTAPSGTVETHSLAAGARLQALFDQTGVWTLTATILPLSGEDPIVLDSEIRVSSASLSPTPIIMENTAREWSPAISDELVELEADSNFALSEITPGLMPRDYEIHSKVGSGHVLARLPEGGAILDVTSPSVIRDYSREQSYNQVVETFADGTVMVSAYIYLNEVPDGLSVDLSIVKSGLTFDDGTNERIISAADFDEQGRYLFYLLRAPGVGGGNCYRYWFEQDGSVIGSW